MTKKALVILKDAGSLPALREVSEVAWFSSLSDTALVHVESMAQLERIRRVPGVVAAREPRKGKVMV